MLYGIANIIREILILNNYYYGEYYYYFSMTVNHVMNILHS